MHIAKLYFINLFKIHNKKILIGFILLLFTIIPIIIYFNYFMIIPNKMK